MTEKPVIEILWTGGFDSSFRVTQLSMLPVIIQPYYLSDQRPSENMELNAIGGITKLIKAKSASQCELLALKYIQIKERIKSQEITDAFERIKKHHHLGTQYDWLGCFASLHTGIEIGILTGGHWTKILNKYGKLIMMSNKVFGDYYIVDTKHSSDDFNTLFQHYRFPIAAMTKLELKKKYIDWGYEDIMNLTWFCFNPIDGEPCGECNPCKITIESGLKERIPKSGQRRYLRRKYFSPLLKFESKIIKIYKRVIRKIRYFC